MTDPCPDCEGSGLAKTWDNWLGFNLDKCETCQTKAEEDEDE